MARKSETNGFGKVTVEFRQIADDWVLFYSSKPIAEPDQYYIYLSRAMGDWIKLHPKVRITHTLPMLSAGSTVAVHVWFSGALSPTPHPQAEPQA
jgi:hypothetical protein